MRDLQNNLFKYMILATYFSRYWSKVQYDKNNLGLQPKDYVFAAFSNIKIGSS